MSNSRQSVKGALTILGVLTVALSVFGGASFGLLRVATPLPTWVVILISIPIAVSAFAFFVWAHQTNGFDGPLISMDEVRAKMEAMTPSEREQYLAGFAEADREILERALRHGTG